MHCWHESNEFSCNISQNNSIFVTVYTDEQTNKSRFKKIKCILTQKDGELWLFLSQIPIIRKNIQYPTRDWHFFLKIMLSFEQRTETKIWHKWQSVTTKDTRYNCNGFLKDENFLVNYCDVATMNICFNGLHVTTTKTLDHIYLAGKYVTRHLYSTWRQQTTTHTGDGLCTRESGKWSSNVRSWFVLKEEKIFGWNLWASWNELNITLPPSPPKKKQQKHSSNTRPLIKALPISSFCARYRIKLTILLERFSEN